MLLITSHYFHLNCFAILLIDDYHNFHAKKVLTKLMRSTAIHMVFCLLDIHPTIPELPHPQQTPLHRPVRITIKGTEVTCYGGIENRVITQKMHQALVNMKKTFVNQLPRPILQLNPKQWQEYLRQLRQVSRKSHKLKFEIHVHNLDNKKKYLFKVIKNYM